MMRTLKKTLARMAAALTAMCMLASCAAAEETPDFSAMLPLLER